MAIFQQTLPASLRSGSTETLEDRGVPAADRRPYLIAVPARRPVASVRQSVASTTRQFFTLFPHESEDARITGATRSLYRRLLALNLPRTSARAEASMDLQDVTEVRFALTNSKIA
ncbi:MAG: hypothetical protein ABI286_06865 [Edaphobacter sp.]